MSDYEYHTGTAKKVKIPAGETINSVLMKVVKEQELEGFIEDYGCLSSMLRYESDESYFIDEKTKTLWKLNNKEGERSDYVAEANLVDDDTINYTLHFYNGGCGMMECLEDAFNNIKNDG